LTVAAAACGEPQAVRGDENAERLTIPVLRSLLDQGDVTKTRAALEAAWQPYAMNPQVRTPDEQKRLAELFALACSSKDSSIRLTALRFLASLGAKECFPLAMAEYRAALFAGDKAADETLEPVVGLFVRQADVELREHLAAARNYWNRVLALVLYTGAAESVSTPDLVSAVIMNRDSKDPYSYRVARGALLVLAERNAVEAKELIDSALKSELRVHQKGGQFYPLRTTGALATRILEMVQAQPGSEDYRRLTGSLVPRGSDEDRSLFFWFVEYVKRQKSKDGVEVLKRIRSLKGLDELTLSAINDAIRAVESPP
jgi:hypothetical protein